MEEKILIESEINKKTKRALQAIALIMLLWAAMFFIILLTSKVEYTVSRYYAYEMIGLEAAFNGSYPEFTLVFILFCIIFVIGVILLITYFALSKCSISITENNVKGKTLFGKEVILPLYMVSAFSTRKFLSTITVATSSGVTKFSLIKNYAEIGNELSRLINERQYTTKTKESTPQTNATDELIKLKTLLDSGIITQEEFDAKKKQLLGI